MCLEIAAPANRAVPVKSGNRNAGISEKSIFGVFLRRAGISAKRASPPNRPSPAHVIGPLHLLRTNFSKITFELNLIVLLRFRGLRSSVFVLDTTIQISRG